jgi:GST-like protein
MARIIVRPESLMKPCHGPALPWHVFGCIMDRALQNAPYRRTLRHRRIASLVWVLPVLVSKRGDDVIRLYFHPTPNPAKIALFLEETALPYEVVPIDTSKGEQHAPEFRAINPNGKVPAIVDTDGPGGVETRVFDSSAILLYLGEKTGQLMGVPAERGELLSWLFYISSGLGPFSGQAVHFQRAAPDKLPYAINRYRREAERHYGVLDKHLMGRSFIVGSSFSIVDVSAWGWIDRAKFVLPGSDDPLAPFPNIKRWFRSIDERPAVAKTRAIGGTHAFKKELDEEARRALFPSNYPPAST